MKALKKKAQQSADRRRQKPVDAVSLPKEVVEVSAELFPGPIEAHWDSDPELPDEQFIVVTASAGGQLRHLVERRREWHRRVSQSLPETNIRLCLTSIIV